MVVFKITKAMVTDPAASAIHESARNLVAIAPTSLPASESDTLSDEEKRAGRRSTHKRSILTVRRHVYPLVRVSV